jgi:hypothetical protein
MPVMNLASSEAKNKPALATWWTWASYSAMSNRPGDDAIMPLALAFIIILHATTPQAFPSAVSAKYIGGSVHALVVFAREPPQPKLFWFGVAGLWLLAEMKR